MKKLVFLIVFYLNLQANEYLMPPTSQSFGYVPVISDEMMKKCIKVYNQKRWLEDSLSAPNLYSEYEVNNYNIKVQKIENLTNWFNINCAGKQSQSACKMTNELNRQQGLPVIDCRVGY